jgi:hypothetical protein
LPGACDDGTSGSGGMSSRSMLPTAYVRYGVGSSSAGFIGTEGFEALVEGPCYGHDHVVDVLVVVLGAEDLVHHLVCDCGEFGLGYRIERLVMFVIVGRWLLVRCTRDMSCVLGVHIGWCAGLGVDLGGQVFEAREV